MVANPLTINYPTSNLLAQQKETTKGPDFLDNSRRGDTPVPASAKHEKRLTDESLDAEHKDGVAAVGDKSVPAPGRIISLDPGTKRVGVAVCDETRTVVRPLERFERTSWKKLLISVKAIVEEYDAAALVIGLPLESDGSESKMSREARRLAQNFALSLELPVFLQDERVSSYEAKSRLWEQGVDLETTRLLVDSEAAVIILEDFLSSESTL